MSKVIAFVCLNLAFLAIAPALNGTCQLCEDIREKNRQAPPNPYTYYEDYLKAEGGQKQVESNPEDSEIKKDKVPKVEKDVKK